VRCTAWLKIKNPVYRRFAIVTELFATRQPEQHVAVCIEWRNCRVTQDVALRNACVPVLTTWSL
jgi:hypothetical protein